MGSAVLGHELSDATNTFLQAWVVELRTSGAKVDAQMASANTVADGLIASVPTRASVTLGTIAHKNRVVLTAFTPGKEAHLSKVRVIRSPGRPSLLSVTHDSDYNTYIVALACNYWGQVTTTPMQLKTYLAGNAWFYSVTAPDATRMASSQVTKTGMSIRCDEALIVNDYKGLGLLPPGIAAPTSFGEGVSTTDLPMELQDPTHFSGGNDAAVTTLEKSLATLLGTSIDNALTVLGLPVPSVTDTAAQLLEGLGSDWSFLSTGTPFQAVGTNLVALRNLWTLLGGNSAATAIIYAASWVEGIPLVWWWKEVTTSITAEVCDGGEVTYTTTQVALSTKPNVKPVEASSASVWWPGKISSSHQALASLQASGVSDVTPFLKESGTSQVVVTPSLISSLTQAEFTELMGLEVLGTTLITVVDAVSSIVDSGSLAPPGAITAPNWSVPLAPTKKELNPLTSADQAASLALAVNDKCLKTVPKDLLAGFVGVVGAAADSVSAKVSVIKSKLTPIFNRISKLLSATQPFIDNMPSLTCVVGADLGSLKLEIKSHFNKLKWLSYELRQVSNPLTASVNYLLSTICSVDQAIMSLVGPELADQTGKAIACIPKPLTNAALLLKDELLKSMGCVENPLGFIEELDKISTKLNALSLLLHGLMLDFQMLAAEVRMMVDAVMDQLLDGSESNMVVGRDCQSPTLSGMVKAIKGSVGL